MLYRHDADEPTYVIGSGIFATECQQVLAKLGITQVHQVDYTHFHEVPHHAQCILGFNNVIYRRRFFQNITVDNYQWPSFVHASAIVEQPECLGRGVWIYPFVYVGYQTTVGDFNVLGGRADLGHAVHTGRNNYFGPGVCLTGGIKTGDNVFFGANTTVANHIDVCGDTYFLMHSVVHKPVTQPGNYFGNRAVPGDKVIQTR
jgi:acyl-[acyl carrier protein]--UDP-N-acetylglucosamine O-acyltransferase